jgi:hypothetical protein
LERLTQKIKTKPSLPKPDILAKLESYGYYDNPKYKNNMVLIAAYSEYLRRLNLS